MDMPDSLKTTPPKPTADLGSITIMIRDVGDQSPEAQQQLFVAVMGRLKVSARSMLRQFPKVREWNEDDLVNEVYEHLITRLLDKRIKNRTHLFATACIYFRWKLLDLVKRKNLETELLFEEHLISNDEPNELEQTESLTFAFSQLDKISNASRQIFEAHVFLGMSFTEISTMLRIPKSTVHDHFMRAKRTLRKAFQNLYL